jgi:hypothetical protein
VSIGFNDVLRFDEGTDQRQAWLHPDDYDGATGAEVATQLTTDLDAAGIDPLDLSPSLWLRADDLELADGADVSAWNDVSGNARHLDTSSGTQTYSRNAVNGRPAVRFANDGYLYAAANAVQWDDITGTNGVSTIMAVVWVDQDQTAFDAIITSTGVVRGMFVDSSGFLYCRGYDGTQDNAIGSTDLRGGWHILTYNADLTNVDGYADDMDDAGREATVASGNQTNLANDVLVGSSSIDHLKGFIAELIVFPSDLTEENRRRVTYYLAQKYGITAATSATTAPAWANTYTASYSDTAYKFTLARATGAATIGFPWTEAAWLDRSVGLDLGFDVTADDTGATTYTADNAAYQSRHVIEVDFGTARTARAVAIINHNFESDAVLTLEGHTAPYWEGTPDYSATLDYHASNVVKFFTTTTKQYWRLVVDDVQNETGFTEIGAVFLGDYYEPTSSYRPGFQIVREELSGIGFSDHGAAYMDDKPTLKGYRLLFRPVLDADRLSFETMFEWVKTSRHFFVCLDSAGGDEEGETKYGFLSDTPAIKHLENSTTLYSITLDFVEAAL